MTTALNVNATPEKPYAVNLWGSHPDEGNDDCDTGENFATIDEARAAFADIGGMLRRWDAENPDKCSRAVVCFADWAFAEIDGPDVYEVKPNPDQRRVRARRREAERSDAEWRSERAMQAGMAFGCDGYNDEMGF